jgi:hypothetical protein
MGSVFLVELITVMVTFVFRSAEAPHPYKGLYGLT